MSHLENIFEIIIKSLNIDYQREYKFCENRRFRVDFALPALKIAIEIEGGIWSVGRHNRASGFIKDIEKYNLLTLEGWALLRYSTNEINNKQFTVINDLMNLIESRKKLIDAVNRQHT